MNSCLRLILVSLAAGALLASRSLAGEPGHVDFGKLTGSKKGECVEVTLSKGVLKLAGVLVRAGNPEAADIIGSLSRVRVNVVRLDDRNREDVTQRIATVRETLARDGWEQVVNAVKRQEDVMVYLKQGDGEAIEGIVVTVIDERKHEAVFVNVVGNIKPEQLAALGEHLQIQQLKLGGKKAGKS